MHNNRKIRENAGFVLLNLVSGHDGAEFVLENGLIHFIIKYF